MTRARRSVQVLACLAAGVIGLVTATAQQSIATATFAPAQAAAGQQMYAKSCASCHAPDLRGGNEAPPLAGVNFMNVWRERSVPQLSEFIQRTMPPGGPRLSADQTQAVTAFILQSNAAQPGAQAAAPQQVFETPTRPRVIDNFPPGRGLTVKGQVPNYVPVTDAMLRNPPDGDWLMIRRNYQAWSHSPLTEITPANVTRLKLAWTWAMREGGANEPTPIVHNGIIYLYNTNNVVQALDGATGDLIWEHSVGPEAIVGQGAIRSLALYQDKLFVATTDAHLVALNAVTGAQVWTATVADRSKAFTITSGPIVIKGKVLQGLSRCERFGPDRCSISAYDAETGTLVWKFHTIAERGEPGGDTWADRPNEFRKGGETWITGSYDPELDLTFWGIAQAKPWVAASRNMKTTDRALYTSSTVALRPDTGRLEWFLQHSPGESLDLDEVYERVLVDAGGRKFIFTIGKPGILWKVDRVSGQFISYKETVHQNIFDRVDESGTPGTARRFSPRKWATGCRSAPVLKAGTTGTRRAITPARSCSSFRWRNPAWAYRAARWNLSRGRAARPAIARSRKCPDRTATSASSRPTM